MPLAIRGALVNPYTNMPDTSPRPVREPGESEESYRKRLTAYYSQIAEQQSSWTSQYWNPQPTPQPIGQQVIQDVADWLGSAPGLQNPMGPMYQSGYTEPTPSPTPYATPMSGQSGDYETRSLYGGQGRTGSDIASGVGDVLGNIGATNERWSANEVIADQDIAAAQKQREAMARTAGQAGGASGATVTGGRPSGYVNPEKYFEALRSSIGELPQAGTGFNYGRLLGDLYTLRNAAARDPGMFTFNEEGIPVPLGVEGQQFNEAVKAAIDQTLTLQRVAAQNAGAGGSGAEWARLAFEREKEQRRILEQMAMLEQQGIGMQTTAATNQMNSMAQNARYAVMPGQQYYMGYEPGGPTEQLYKLAGASYNPELYRAQGVSVPWNLPVQTASAATQGLQGSLMRLAQ